MTDKLKHNAEYNGRRFRGMRFVSLALAIPIYIYIYRDNDAGCGVCDNTW